MTPQKPKRDFGFLFIVGLVVANAVWLLLMPVIPAIASSTMHRFHLATSSFAVWAIPFPVPSMYNFANTYKVSDYPPGLVDPILELDNERYINHFPARVMTFANTRNRHFGADRDRWFTLRSSYRGQTLESRFHAKAFPDYRFEIVRLPAEASK